MKLIVLLFFIFGLCTAIYLFITYFFLHYKRLKKINWIAFGVSSVVGLALISLIGFAVYQGSKKSDTWCTTSHVTNAYPPANEVTAMDYFEKGNYEYDKGMCNEALESYGKSIKLNPKYPESYNNRAYTYMRQEKFDLAIADLNKAIELNPDYKNALRNRADVNNYHIGAKDKAVVDYEKIIQLSGSSTDVCAHLADAKNYSKKPLSFISTLWSTISCVRNSK